MGIFDIFKVKQYQEEIQKLKEQVEQLKPSKEELNYININKEIEKILKEKEYIESDIKKLDNEKIKLENDIKNLKNKLSYYENELEFESIGIYKNYYNFENAQLYKNLLDKVREEQKQMVKAKIATNHSLDYMVDGSKVRGKEFINDTIKLSLKAFNNECSNFIDKVKFNNINNLELKINKSFEQINALTDMQKVSIKKEYLELKIKELHIKYEYECKKQQEKEEQEAIKDRMREEALVQKEIEKELAKLEKEETHFTNAKVRLQEQIKSWNENDEKYKELMKKIEELDKKLEEVRENKFKAEKREQNTRAGYVYVISNIGSFGEDVYKIGMTRRLDPMDRVKELGSASVPFNFDVHAIIFSDDAPNLENQLHKRLSEYQVNKVNPRKEFFKVSLNEIESVVKEEFKEATIEFTKVAIAEEFRKSLECLEVGLAN